MSHLACPTCHAPLADPRCEACARDYADAAGRWDFVGAAAGAGGLAQSLMESRLATGVYEGGIRPTLTRLVGGPSYATEARWLSDWLKDAAGPALDLACGTGRYTRWLAERLGPDAAFGVDLSAPMLAGASARSPALTFARGSALSVPVADASLGALVCFGALHLFPDPAAAIAEWGRCLRPGGVVATLFAAERPRTRALQRWAGRAIGLHFLEVDRVSAEMGRAGLRLSAREDAGWMTALCARRVC
jgi:SAM-dependent methyltransferase